MLLCVGAKALSVSPPCVLLKRLATKLREFHVNAPWILVLPTLYGTDIFRETFSFKARNGRCGQLSSNESSRTSSI